MSDYIKPDRLILRDNLTLTANRLIGLLHGHFLFQALISGFSGAVVRVRRSHDCQRDCCCDDDALVAAVAGHSFLLNPPP
jgi:hypothetical protein